MVCHKNIIPIILLTFICVTTGGCAILQIPGQIVGGTFSLLGKILEVAKAMPKPPPGVFPGVF